MKVVTVAGRVRSAARVCVAIGILVFAAIAPGEALAKKKVVPPEFRWSAAVRLPAIDRPTLEAISLDSAIFAATQSDLTDLRLRSPTGSLAFVVRQVPATKERELHNRWVAVERGAKPLPPNGLEIFIDPPADEPGDRMGGPPTGISIGTPLRNFEQQVRVFSSSDGEHWQPVSPPTLIFDYSRFVDVRSVDVPIHPTTDRHFRLVIDDVTAEEAAQLHDLTRHFVGAKEVEHSDRTTVDRRPFRVDQITFYRNQVTMVRAGLQTIQYPTADFRVEEDPQSKDTVLAFSSQREPLMTVKLLTDETNFSRLATLQIPIAGRTKEEWHIIASATLSRFSLEALKKNMLTLTFPELRSDRYRIVIENGDSPPVSFSGVEVEGPEYQMVFLATPGQTLMLDYGWPGARAANYDTAAISASLGAGVLPQRAELEESVENPAAGKSVGGGWAFAWSDMRVWTLLVAGLSILLGWGLYQAARRIDAAPPE